jgi:hypothetical protein
MTEFTLQPTRAYLPWRGFNPRDRASATLGQQPAREISVLPFVLAAAVLFATNVWIATRLQGESERAMLFAAFGAVGAPIFQWSPSVCRSASGRTPTVRLDRADLLSLLAGN